MKMQRGLWVALTIFIAVICHADTITWTNAAGGSFQDPLNWSPNVVPYTNDTAVFELTDGPYTVTWEANITNHTQIINAGTVTFDLKGYTYSLDKLSTNTIGLTQSTALVTFTNGTVQRLDVEYISGAALYFYLRGKDSTLHLRNAKYLDVAYYHFMYQDTRIVVDGPDAYFRSFGAAYRTAGHLSVTNGAFLYATASLNLNYNTGSVHISGPGYRAIFSINNAGMAAGASLLMDKDVVVNHGYFTARDFPISIAGTITLNDARWYNHYLDLDRGWLSLDSETALLQGSGSVEMHRIIMNGGTIRPGCEQGVGLLSFTGHITNAVPISVLDMEIGGPTTNDYDRISLVADKRGNGTLYAGGVLNISALNGYEPERKTIFKLIDAVEIVPAFDTINYPDWDGVWDTEQLYTDGEITFIPQRGSVFLLR